MKLISEDLLLRTRLRTDGLHILCAGFEDRCLGYPRWLSQNISASTAQRIICLDPGDENVSPYLAERRQENKREIRRLFGGTQFVRIEDALETLRAEELPQTVCLDVSTLPRRWILELFGWFRTGAHERNVYVIYTYPEEYDVGPLESPSADFEVFEHGRATVANQRTRLILIPGFDREATSIVLCWARERFHRIDEVWWLFPFLKRYAFYERALQVHLDLIKPANYKLFSQDHIGAAVQQLKFLIANWEAQVIIAPLGPRVSAVAVALASCVGPRRSSLTITFPKTARYESLRSQGADVPLAEEVGWLLKE